MGVNVITTREAHEWGVDRVVETVKGIVGDRPTYLTFDIDALDPARE
jgi:agmatinase